MLAERSLSAFCVLCLFVAYVVHPDKKRHARNDGLREPDRSRRSFDRARANR